MSIARCSQCHLPMTSAESAKGVCPVCAATLARPGATSSAVAPARAPAGRSSGFLRNGLLGLCLLTGGFLLHPVIASNDSAPETPQPGASSADPKASAKHVPPSTDAAKALERVQEIEAVAVQLGEELEAEQTKAADAQAQADGARRELNKLRAESSKSKDGRMKELLASIDNLNRDVESHKKELAQAKAREEAALRGAKPQDGRAMAAEALNKKLLKVLDAQTKSAKDAKTREDAARRQTEQVRQDGQRALEQERQQNQRTVEQLRQDYQRTVEQVRQQLRQQELVTQKVRNELEQQKRATEEAKRKNKS